jgi:hypothetical protein
MVCRAVTMYCGNSPERYDIHLVTLLLLLLRGSNSQYEFADFYYSKL